MTHFLYEGEWLHACKMWAGGCNTATIAAKFECSEAMIYRELPHYRKKYPKISERHEPAQIIIAKNIARQYGWTG